LRALAIVVFRGKIVIFLGENRFFGSLIELAHNLEVAGSNPVPATFL
jgi:hypothetical protein